MRSLFTVLALAVSATCATPNAGNAAAMTFNCDVPSNRYSILSMELATPLRISGIIEPLTLRSGNFLPAATIRVANEAGNVVAFQLITESRRASRLAALLIVRNEGNTDERRIAQVNRDPLPFALSVSADGMVRLEVAGSSFDAETLPMGSTTVSVSCTSGEFTFSDLQLESDPPSKD